MSNGFNPNQPRVPKGIREGGQWTDDERWTGAEKSARKAAGLDDPETLRWDVFNDKREILRGLKHERAYFANPTTGEKIMQVDGDETSVRLTEEQNRLSRGSIFIHNHPSGNKSSGVVHAFFSHGDLLVAVDNRMRGIAVVSGDFYIEAEFPVGWIEENLKVHLDIYGVVNNVFRNCSDYLADRIYELRPIYEKILNRTATREEENKYVDGLSKSLGESGIKSRWERWR